MLQSLIAFPKVKRQVLLCEPEAKQPKDFHDNTMFWVNQEFGIMWVDGIVLSTDCFVRILQIFVVFQLELLFGWFNFLIALVAWIFLMFILHFYCCKF